MYRMIMPFVVFFVACASLAVASSHRPVDVFVNNSRLDFADQPAVVADGTAHAPLRPLAEVFGAQVEWDGVRQVAIARMASIVMEFDAVFGLTIGGRLLVPMRPIVETYGARMSWNAAARRVDILMPDKPLLGKKVAILVEEGFHDQELDIPRQALIAQGAATVLVGSEAGKTYEDYRGQNFFVTADMAAADARAADFDALLVPGGKAPAIMRESEAMLRLVREFNNQGKPIAAICHGPWVLVSAGIAAGKKMTCVSSIADDLRAAGADYRDEPVVVDGNLITSRTPPDLEVFSEALIKALSTP